jgi:peroxiredoxin
MSPSGAPASGGPARRLVRGPRFRQVALSALLAALAAMPLGACAPQRPQHPFPDDTTRSLSQGAPAAVIVFFAAHCPCQAAHDERLRQLHEAYAPRGVTFLLVDAEADATPERAMDEARRRRYPFPLRADPDGKLADALGARYATYTVVLDAAGRIRYRGGIDSDRKDLHDDARRYLGDALDDVLAGREVRVPEGKTLGCSLRRR